MMIFHSLVHIGCDILGCQEDQIYKWTIYPFVNPNCNFVPPASYMFIHVFWTSLALNYAQKFSAEEKAELKTGMNLNTVNCWDPLNSSATNFKVALQEHRISVICGLQMC